MAQCFSRRIAMNKLTAEQIKKMIMEEMSMLIKDDALFHKRDVPGDIESFEDYDTEDYEDDTCQVCGDKEGMCHHHEDEDGHKKKSYMAKPQLMKIARYAQRLHDMIPDGMTLDDWQESHIAQLADDIGEVYHSLEYKLKFKK